MLTPSYGYQGGRCAEAHPTAPRSGSPRCRVRLANRFAERTLLDRWRKLLHEALPARQAVFAIDAGGGICHIELGDLQTLSDLLIDEALYEQRLDQLLSFA